ncbi:MAG TPA: alpha/beta hydrolase domain-containing protein [Acidimicrobiia bacterium]|nr:alpha/beta hydrolase domain-containing protein [Acidimicrobiia bacterium]
MAVTETARGWRVEGPVPGTPTLLLGNFDLAEHGYVVEEFFIEGTARSFSEGPGGVQPADEAPYRTRLVVVRPDDPSTCSGTVVAEWLNVSGGGDGCPDWAFMHRQIMRTRSVFVAVSAQRVGIEGGGILGDMGTALKQVAPERYATLQHPGDAFAFDMYSQVAEALRNHPALLAGMEPECVVAVGESQSAVFLATYINKVDPLAEVYDAFLVHGRGSRGASLTGDMGVPRGNADVDPTDLAAAMARFRQEAADPIVAARVPVITVQSETDVIRMYGFGARCPDSDNTRLWEIAGAAHFDSWGMIAAHEDDGTLAPERLAELGGPTDEPLGLKSEEPINSGPQQHYVLMAALSHLDRWARDGTPAPHAPVLATTGDGDTLALELDEHGNVRGGLRTPWVDVPAAVLSGIGAMGGGFTMLFGVTRPFDAATLARLYPGGVDDYLEKFAVAAESARANGHLLAEDVPEIIGVARASWRA